MTTQAQINEDAEEYRRKFGHIIVVGSSPEWFLRAVTGAPGPWTLPLDDRTRVALENASVDLREDFPGMHEYLLRKDDKYRAARA